MCDAYAQYAAGRQARELAKYNASISRVQAQDALARGEEAAQQINREASLIVGAQRAGFAGQGVAVDSGSALELQVDTERLAQENIVRIRINAAREAWGHRVDAEFEEYRGKMAQRAATTRAISSLASGVTDLIGQFGKTDGDGTVESQANDLAQQRSVFGTQQNSGFQPFRRTSEPRIRFRE